MPAASRDHEAARPEPTAVLQRDGLQFDGVVGVVDRKISPFGQRVDDQGIEGTVAVQVAEVDERDVRPWDLQGRAGRVLSGLRELDIPEDAPVAAREPRQSTWPVA